MHWTFEALVLLWEDQVQLYRNDKIDIWLFITALFVKLYSNNKNHFINFNNISSVIYK